jgi:hypothetical protein
MALSWDVCLKHDTPLKVHVEWSQALPPCQPRKVQLARSNVYLEELELQGEPLKVLFEVGSATVKLMHPISVHMSREKSAGSVCSSDSAETALGSSCSSDSDTDSVDDAKPICVTLRHLPTAYTKDRLDTLLKEQGFRDTYLSLHVPMDGFRQKCKGFAFVKFKSHVAAMRCMAHFQGFAAWGSGSQKVCAVEWSAKQDHGVEMQVDKSHVESSSKK